MFKKSTRKGISYSDAIDPASPRFLLGLPKKYYNKDYVLETKDHEALELAFKNNKQLAEWKLLAIIYPDSHIYITGSDFFECITDKNSRGLFVFKRKNFIERLFCV